MEEHPRQIITTLLTEHSVSHKIMPDEIGIIVPVQTTRQRTQVGKMGRKIKLHHVDTKFPVETIRDTIHGLKLPKTHDIDVVYSHAIIRGKKPTTRFIQILFKRRG
ncbi:MAG: hypothetical protein Q8R15_01810 [Candidatus Micrarchaeota archaeon]|nr:hypothetical protein [Candidatus Micrarchaeota archaeon]